jgi:rare lipoprotein A
MERMERFIIIAMCFFCLSSFYESTWYNLEGNITKSGEVFRSNGMTCASNKFPIGAILKITNKENKKSVIVRCNDTGKMSDNVIDLSKGAFKKIAKLEEGRINVKVNIIRWK